MATVSPTRKGLWSGLTLAWSAVHLFLLLLGVAMYQEAVLGSGWPMLLALSALWTVLLLSFAAMFPEVTLEEDGVSVRVLRSRRFYPWKEIKQAGILPIHHRYGWYNALLLVKPKGSRRRYRDKTFLLRNRGRLIEVPNTEENRSFVIRHYGPLDFDLSDHRPERSTVVD